MCKDSDKIAEIYEQVKVMQSTLLKLREDVLAIKHRGVRTVDVVRPIELSQESTNNWECI